MEMDKWMFITVSLFMVLLLAFTACEKGDDDDFVVANKTVTDFESDTADDETIYDLSEEEFKELVREAVGGEEAEVLLSEDESDELPLKVEKVDPDTFGLSEYQLFVRNTRFTDHIRYTLYGDAWEVKWKEYAIIRLDNVISKDGDFYNSIYLNLQDETAYAYCSVAGRNNFCRDRHDNETTSVDFDDYLDLTPFDWAITSYRQDLRGIHSGFQGSREAVKWEGTEHEHKYEYWVETRNGLPLRVEVRHFSVDCEEKGDQCQSNIDYGRTEQYRYSAMVSLA